MLPKASSLAASSFVVIVALGFGWYSFRAADRARLTLHDFEGKHARTDERIRATRQQLTALQRSTAALEAKIEHANPPGLPPKSAADRNPVEPQDPSTLLVSDPVLRALYLTSFRANLALRYGPIYQSLGLTQAQIDKFEELATAQADELVTLHAAALAQGLKLTDSDVTALEKRSDDRFYTTIASEVGEAVAQQMSQLDRISDVQDWVLTSNSFCLPGSQPLTSLQVAQVAQIIANTSPSAQSEDKTDSNSIDWDKVYTQADALLSDLLSGGQIQAFKHAVEIEQYKAINKKIDVSNGVPR
jgi:hypothetical protein